MAVTLSDDEVKFLLHLLAQVQVQPLAPDCAAAVRLVQGLAKKVQPREAKKRVRRYVPSPRPRG